MLDGSGRQALKHLSYAVAQMLWDLKAIRVNVQEPYKLVSGSFSPIYINCRQLISYPTFMNLFTASARMLCEWNSVKADVIAGGETAGIPFAAFIAQSLSLPMVYVRKEKKEHGLSSLVEGQFVSNSGVLLVEDLITDGESKLHFIDSLQACSGKVEHVLVLFDREQGGRETLRARGINLHAITTMRSVIQLAETEHLLSQSELLSVRQYLGSPHEWNVEHNQAAN
jgi:orotate phosphoribosyltransferase